MTSCFTAAFIALHVTGSDVGFYLLLLLIAMGLLYVVLQIRRMKRRYGMAQRKLSAQMLELRQEIVLARLEQALDIPVPLLWNDVFMMAPEAMMLCVERVLRQRAGLILECGSGISTVVFGYAVRKLGAGKVISLEHDPKFAENTRSLVAAHGLSDVVDVVHAPLKEMGTDQGQQPWYDPAAFGDRITGPVDFLLVDGPPGKQQRLARYPALPALIDSLSEDACVVVDDYHRADEKEMVDLWLREFPAFGKQVFTTGAKEVALLCRRSTLNP